MILFRQVGLAYLGYKPARTRDGIPEGSPAPDWNGADAAGLPHSKERYAGVPVMFLFAEPDCAPCQTMMKDLSQFERRAPAALRVVVVATDDHRVNARFAEEYQVGYPILAQANRGLARAFRVQATPFGFGIGADGVVRWRGFVNEGSQMDEIAASVLPNQLPIQKLNGHGEERVTA